MTADVAVCYLHPADDVAVTFHHSLMNMILHDIGGPRRIIKPIPAVASTGGLARARNAVTRKALNETKAEWLFWVDADMGFAPDTIDRLLEVADPATAPVVGGLCFGQVSESTDELATPRLSMFPTMYQWNGEQLLFERLADYPRDAVMRVSGTGAACLLVHRSVFETIAADDGDCWFTHQMHPTGPGGAYGHFGEDMSFCLRLMQHRIPLHVHTGVKTSHLKPRWLNEELFDLELAATPTFVVIPTVGAGGHIKDLIVQLEQQRQADGIFVIDNGCNKATANWLDTHNRQLVHRIPMPDAGIPDMWNAGIDAAAGQFSRCNVALLNDDISIGPNFLAGLMVALRSGWNVAVVGANYDGRPGTGLQPVNEVCANRYDGTGGLPGFAFMVRGESAYQFPTDLRWWYGDTDLVFTHRSRGNVVAIALDVTCEHVNGGGQTGDWESPDMAAVLGNDRAVFEAKWGLVDA